MSVLKDAINKRAQGDKPSPPAAAGAAAVAGAMVAVMVYRALRTG
jgi:hypothetical protein